MRIAIIDCGTNTFNLLVAHVNGRQWDVIFQTKLPVKLGAGSFETGEITTSRFYRGLDALYTHTQNAINYQCERVFAFATSAVRETKNGEAFRQKAKDFFDLDMEIIDGNREAELIFKGVLSTVTLGPEPVLIMDIGGGSTEFIIANDSGILWKKSYLLGVSRLYEQVRPSNRMTHDDTVQLHHILDTSLADLKGQLEHYRPVTLIGSSGSFDTLLEMYLEGTGVKDYVIGLSNEIPAEVFPGIHAWLMGSSLEDRIKHPVIPQMRVEFMPIASYLVHYVWTGFGFKKLIHSAHSLKEGAIFDLIDRFPEISIPSKLKGVD